MNQSSESDPATFLSLGEALSEMPTGAEFRSVSELRSLRHHLPSSSLKRYLDQNPTLSLDEQIELFSIDLIDRIRNGEKARVENYFRYNRELANDSYAMLELIDAEICTRADFGETLNLSDFLKRFPNQESEIRQSFEILEWEREFHDPKRRRGTSRSLPDNFSRRFVTQNLWHEDETGVVFRVRDKKTNNNSLLKLIDCHEIGDSHKDQLEQIQKRFGNRIHPQFSVVSVSGVENGAVYFCMNTVEGMVLSKTMNEPMEPLRACRHAMSIAAIHQYLNQELKLSLPIDPRANLIDHQDQIHLIDPGFYNFVRKVALKDSYRRFSQQSELAILLAKLLIGDPSWDDQAMPSGQFVALREKLLKLKIDNWLLAFLDESIVHRGNDDLLSTMNELLKIVNRMGSSAVENRSGKSWFSGLGKIFGKT